MTPKGIANTLVSVVVPVYNVEAYVGQCLHSILEQSHVELDIVVVDDGSTDSSGDVCEAIAAVDSRVRVFHKENGGLSDARNYGLRRARGEWVSFIDSDDYVSPVFIEALLSAAVSTGCWIAGVPGGHPFHDGDAVRLVPSVDELGEPLKRSARDVQSLMLYQTLTTGVPWRLYNHGEKHDVLGVDPFPVGLYYEDLASTYKFVRAAGDSIAYVESHDLYAYRLRSTSIIRQAYTPRKADSAIKVSRQLYADTCEWYPDLAGAAASRCFSVNRMVYAQVPADMPEERERLWAELVKYRNVVAKDNNARKRERLAAGIACLGEKPFRAFCLAAKRMGLLR